MDPRTPNRDSLRYNDSDRIDTPIAHTVSALMAPMAVYNFQQSKRTSSTANFFTPPAKLNRGPIRRHKVKWDLQRDQRLNPSWQDEESAQSILTRSISLALDAVGFGAAEPEAVESFHGLVEEYMAHYLADVRLSMLSCRRSQPIPQDFLQALHTHQISLRSLLPHLDPPVPPSKSQFPLQLTPGGNEDEEQQFRFLGSLVDDTHNEKTKKHVPRHFPTLPSKHTYKATPDFPEREQDPRKVRERATEEGRLGEEALRRLVGAGFRHPAQETQQRPELNSARAKRDQIWRETIQAVAAESSDGMTIDSGTRDGKGKQKVGEVLPAFFGDWRLGSTVNSEKRYWRKPAPEPRGNM